MSDDLEFKHISVASDDEDEIVIQAGAVRTTPTDAKVNQSNNTFDAAKAVSTQTEDSPAEQSAVTTVEESATADAADVQSNSDSLAHRLNELGLDADDISEEARQEYEQHMRKSAARQQAASMVTTEEDLHTTMPFARMQRIIVIVLLLLIIAAAVYWFVRHPMG